MTEHAAGTEIAGYRIESVIGRGGMATVYLAEDTRLGRKVALKLLSPALSGQEQFQQRFIRESRLAASLDHPNIIPIFEAGDAGGLLFIAMRYVVGSDLKVLLAGGKPLASARTLRLMEQVGDGLDAAHELGLVHRDVKPGNVLITSVHENADHVYLTDFGLTKRTSSLSGGLTSTGHFLGTIDYVAPEQIAGKPVDARSDIYALGCVLYECLSGQPPFHRDDDAATLWSHLAEEPPPVTAVRAELSAAVDAVVTKAMAKSPEDRYGSCRELVEELAEALSLSMPLPRASYRISPVPARNFSGSDKRAGELEQPDETQGSHDRDALAAQHPSFPPGPLEVPVEARNKPDVPDASPPWISENDPNPEQSPMADESDWADEFEDIEKQEEWDDGEPPAATRRRRRWLLPTVLAAALVVVAVVAALIVRPPKTTKLSQHYVSKNAAVPFALDYPGYWQLQEGNGSDVVLTPRVAALGSLFFQRGSAASWLSPHDLLRTDRSHAIGFYGFSTFTPFDTSTTEVMESTIGRQLPATTVFTVPPHAVVLGGSPTEELEGELDDPADANSRLHVVIDLVQTQQTTPGSVLLVFFAAPDRFEGQRALFNRIKATLAFPA